MDLVIGLSGRTFKLHYVDSAVLFNKKNINLQNFVLKYSKKVKKIVYIQFLTLFRYVLALF